jgi:hypothetical protein
VTPNSGAAAQFSKTAPLRIAAKRNRRNAAATDKATMLAARSAQNQRVRQLDCRSMIPENDILQPKGTLIH